MKQSPTCYLFLPFSACEDNYICTDTEKILISLFNLITISHSSNVIIYLYLFFFTVKNLGCEVRSCAKERREKITRTKWSRVVIVRTSEYGFYAEAVQTIQVLFLKKQEDQCNPQLTIFSVAMQQLFSCALQFRANMHKYTHRHAFQSCSCMSHTYAAWLQQKLAMAGPESPHQFLFHCSSLQSNVRYLKIEKGTKLA